MCCTLYSGFEKSPQTFWLTIIKCAHETNDKRRMILYTFWWISLKFDCSAILQTDLQFWAHWRFHLFFWHAFNAKEKKTFGHISEGEASNLQLFFCCCPFLYCVSNQISFISTLIWKFPGTVAKFLRRRRNRCHSLGSV